MTIERGHRYILRRSVNSDGYGYRSRFDTEQKAFLYEHRGESGELPLSISLRHLRNRRSIIGDLASEPSLGKLANQMNADFLVLTDEKLLTESDIRYASAKEKTRKEKARQEIPKKF